jgi:hypothetical protein
MWRRYQRAYVLGSNRKAQAVTLLVCIPEVPGLNFSQDTEYSDVPPGVL